MIDPATRKRFLEDFEAAYRSDPSKFDADAFTDRATALCGGDKGDRRAALELAADCMAIIRRIHEEWKRG